MLYQYIYTYIGNVCILIIIGGLYNNKKKISPSLFLCGLITLLAYHLNVVLNVIWLKAILMFLAIIIANKCYYKNSNKATLVSSFVIELITIISELIVTTIYIMVLNLKTAKDFTQLFNVDIYAIVLMIVCFYLASFKHTKILYNNMLNKAQYITEKKLLLYFVFFSFSVSTFLIFFFYYSPSIFVCIFSILFVIFIAIIIIKSIKNNNEVIDIHKKYDNIILTLQEYEKMVERYRINSHETKNQLITIKYLAGEKKSHEVTEYIENLIDDSHQEDEGILFETGKIPFTALRSITYNKVLDIQEKNIEFFLTVDKKLRKYAYREEEDEKMSYDLSRLFSIFIDNAVQEVTNQEDGCIAIDMYLDEELFIIEISNSITQNLKVENFDNAGFTTKQNGHGYGLTLAKKIVDKNDKIINKKYIADEMFKQKLIIKI